MSTPDLPRRPYQRVEVHDVASRANLDAAIGHLERAVSLLRAYHPRMALLAGSLLQRLTLEKR